MKPQYDNQDGDELEFSEVHDAIELCAKDLGYYELKPEQHQANAAFFKGQDVFAYVVPEDPLFHCPSWNV